MLDLGLVLALWSSPRSHSLSLGLSFFLICKIRMLLGSFGLGFFPRHLPTLKNVSRGSSDIFLCRESESPIDLEDTFKFFPLA